MSVINILSPHVADLIAAGEVVERPASVIKELVENAFDAGAHNITVEIRAGGATYIRVTDDGCGMSPDDAGVAFLRHATSKLHDESGLERISTMGFRGEALAAISSVSHIELLTRRKGESEGTLVTLTAGDIQDMHAAGCPEGTTMTVKDLFYNTPARLKFLKSDRSEASACQLAALRCALAHPEVSVRFIRDGSEEFFSPGDGRGDSVIYTLLGRDMASSMLACTGENGGMKATGYVSSPSAGRGNRAQQYFFCNGRFIRSQLLQAAVEQAYKNTLLTGRYPACVVYITMSFASVDVNVHPAKTEVKFTDERQVFDLVYYAALSALSGENRTKTAESEPERIPAQPNPDFYKSMTAKEYRETVTAAPAAKAVPAPQSTEHVRTTTFSAPAEMKNPEMNFQTRIELPNRRFPTQNVTKVSPSTEHSAPAGSRIVEKPVQNVEKPTIPDHKIVGEALKTYIIVELTGELVLIDKHAAHERMIFDRLKAQDREIMAQTLLAPVTVRPDGDGADILERNGELLSGLGFEIEQFGENDYVVRAVPADMDAQDVPAAIEEICEKLRRGKTLDPAGARDEILHTVACKAAIKAGWDTTPRELERIATEVLSGRVKYCPHGRPVSITVTRKELDKLFKRIV